MNKRNSPATTEEFLRIIYREGYAPEFARQGYILPWPIDIDLGFTSSGARPGPSGEYYEGAASTHGVPKINLRCDKVEPEVLEHSLGHQCIHAAVGAAEGHGKKFFVCAQRMQFVGSKMREVVPGPELTARVHALWESLGPFPRGALKFETHDHAGIEKPLKLAADHPDAQKNRQLKTECLVDGCGYIARVTAKTLREKGAPICPEHKVQMWHERLPPSPEERRAQKHNVAAAEPVAIEHQPVLQIEFQPGGES